MELMLVLLFILALMALVLHSPASRLKLHLGHKAFGVGLEVESERGGRPRKEPAGAQLPTGLAPPPGPQP